MFPGIAISAPPSSRTSVSAIAAGWHRRCGGQPRKTLLHATVAGRGTPFGLPHHSFQGQRYVQYVNRTYQHSGTLWEGRFRSCLTQEEDYLLACQRYIELNPVRANMVVHRADYRWSSYRTNAQGEESKLIAHHPVYMVLGQDADSRQAAYRELFRHELEPGLVDEIRRATNGNFALGGSRFAAQIESALGRRVTPGQSGRPRKTLEPESGDLI